MQVVEARLATGVMSECHLYCSVKTLLSLLAVLQAGFLETVSFDP